MNRMTIMFVALLLFLGTVGCASQSQSPTTESYSSKRTTVSQNSNDLIEGCFPVFKRLNKGESVQTVSQVLGMSTEFVSRCEEIYARAARARAGAPTQQRHVHHHKALSSIPEPQAASPAEERWGACVDSSGLHSVRRLHKDGSSEPCPAGEQQIPSARERERLKVWLQAPPTPGARALAIKRKLTAQLRGQAMRLTPVRLRTQRARALEASTTQP
jgi:hypothetical protein